MKKIFDEQFSVDVILPNYNKFNFLEEAINSVLAQTFKNWHMYIIDDHSTDNSVETINKFSNLANFFSDQSAMDQVFGIEFQTKMVNDYLWTEDRMSMSHSVEERVPFLDRDLVDFAFSIPAGLKMKCNSMSIK